MPGRPTHRCLCRFAAIYILFAAQSYATAQSPQDDEAHPAAVAPADAPATSPRQAEREAAFAKMLGGATLDGSYTSTGPGRDPTKLSHDKYTLGEVRKVGGDRWLIEARIQYAEHDVTLPITVPVRWAGDTPVIVVDNLGLEPFGTVSARVMFFGGHYAGYWKHGRQGGHLFGVIRPGDAKPPQPSDDDN